MPTQPQAIIFDLGNTLLVEDSFDRSAGVKAVCRQVGIDGNERVTEADQRDKELGREARRLRGTTKIELSWQQRWRLILSTMGITPPPDMQELEWLYWSTACALPPEPEVKRALEAIDAAGIKRAVVSNAQFSSNTLKRELDRCGLLDGFALVLSSADTGIRKPHPAIFEAALGRLGVNGRACWCIGDRRDTDVKGAQTMGMTTVLYAAHKSDEDDSIKADFTISDWAEFRGLLAACG